MASILSIKGLVVEYPTLTGIVKAVDNVDLEIKEGEWISIVGESGSGKSTLAFSIIKLIPPPGLIRKGEIIYKGTTNLAAIKEDDMRHYRGKEIGMIFQDPMTSLDPLRTIGDQISEALLEHKMAENKEEALQKAKEILLEVGMPEDRINYYPHQLSGGQRQRAMIASSIILRPAILIADEPTTALDVIVQDKIMSLLEELRKEYKMTIILITHDIALASTWSDRIAVMYAGEIVEVGKTDEIIEDPLHPYTQGLIKSTPDIWSNRKLEGIPGNPPDLRNPPKGCRFHPRCPYVMDKCRQDKPGKLMINGREASCFLLEGK